MGQVELCHLPLSHKVLLVGLLDRESTVVLAAVGRLQLIQDPKVGLVALHWVWLRDQLVPLGWEWDEEGVLLLALLSGA